MNAVSRAYLVVFRWSFRRRLFPYLVHISESFWPRYLKISPTSTFKNAYH